MGALHHENISFYIIFSPNNPVILGLPWLRSHNPHISWTGGQIIHWDNTFHEHCLTPIVPLPVQSIILTDPNPNIPGLPAEYADFMKAFSKIKASQLPPHHSSDCAIELLPGATPVRLEFSLYLNECAVRPIQLSFSIPILYQWCFSWHARLVGKCIYWWHTDLFEHSGRTHSAGEICSKTPHSISAVRQGQEMWVSLDANFANFYRWFIRNFSTAAAPLTSMTKRSTSRLSWNPEVLLVFQELKTRFTSSPILHHPDPGIPFIVEVDASSKGIGAVLSQVKVIQPKCSHVLSIPENYQQPNKTTT